MLDETNPKGKIIAAAMRLAAGRSWREVTLLDIAEAAGSDLAEVRRQVGSKSGIMRALIEAADAAVLAKAARRATEQSPRDRLFEVVMSRFDALEPHKPALRSIIGDAEPDPALLRSALESQHWMLEAAGIGSGGARGAVRTLGLAALYASVFRTWLDDDDPGLARTMAALDRRLRRGEQNLRALDAVVGTARRFGDMLRPRSSPRGRGASPDPHVSTPRPDDPELGGSAPGPNPT